MRSASLSVGYLLVASALTGGCQSGAAESAVEISLDLPSHFPDPAAPDDNPLTAASIELGRHLFYDPRLSSNGTLACASCHKQEFAFADDRALSLGVTEEEGVLNAPSLSNVIYAQPLTWNHAQVTSIEEQLLGPMFGSSPLEMGLSGNEEKVTQRLVADQKYVRLFEMAYPGAPMDLDVARFALASFVRSLLSYQAPFDRFLAGDQTAISQEAVRGSKLFYSGRLGCSHCHVGFGFTTAIHSIASQAPGTSPYHNIGLYNLDAAGSYPGAAQGLIEETGFDSDMGRFRVPTLRNIALTAPYGHDGSVATLEAFIQLYEAGGRNLLAGANAGDGRNNPWRSDELRSFSLSDTERQELIAFLQSLSDTAFTTDPKHASPW